MKRQVSTPNRLWRPRLMHWDGNPPSSASAHDEAGFSANPVIRADVFLVRKGFAASRAEANAAIAAGCVRANDQKVIKPSALLPDDADVTFQRAHPYVSR